MASFEFWMRFTALMLIISLFNLLFGWIFGLFGYMLMYLGSVIGSVIGILFSIYIFPYRKLASVKKDKRIKKQSYLTCPRCNIPVEKTPGICPECGKQI